MAGIQLEQLTKHYKRGGEVIRALDGVTLDIAGGEFVAVVGRSGSGKTTMLDLMGLLLRPTSGRFLIDGVNTGELSDSARAHTRAQKIGFVFQEYNLLASLNVIENVMLPLRYTKGVRDGRRRATELLERVDLSDRVKHRPADRPSLILLDEPTGAVDTETAEQLVALLKRINRQEGVTIIIVTHDLDIAAQAGRVIRLKDGKVIADDAQVPAGAFVGS